MKKKVQTSLLSEPQPLYKGIVDEKKSKNILVVRAPATAQIVGVWWLQGWEQVSGKGFPQKKNLRTN